MRAFSGDKSLKVWKRHRNGRLVKQFATNFALPCSRHPFGCLQSGIWISAVCLFHNEWTPTQIMRQLQGLPQPCATASILIATGLLYSKVTGRALPEETLHHLTWNNGNFFFSKCQTLLQLSKPNYGSAWLYMAKNISSQSASHGG